MKKQLISAAIVLSLAVPALSMAGGPTTFEDKISYSMGFEVGNYFKGAGGDIKREQLIKGIEDAYSGTTPAMTSDEMLAIKKEFALKMQTLQKAKLAEMMAKNKADGEAFLAENLKKEGVVVTDSGLQYNVIQEGKGDKAIASDTVTVEYTGTFINGEEFDSTAKHGKPATFKVGQVIPGWSEALQFMNPGSKLHLVIPSNLAYGEKGVAPHIQPNSVLVFDVELLEIAKDK